MRGENKRGKVRVQVTISGKLHEEMKFIEAEELKIAEAEDRNAPCWSNVVEMLARKGVKAYRAGKK